MTITDENCPLEKPSPVLVYSKHKTRFLIHSATITYWLRRHLWPCFWKQGFLQRQSWKIRPFRFPCVINSWQDSQEGVLKPTPWLACFSPMDRPNYKSFLQPSEVILLNNATYEEACLELMWYPLADKGWNVLCATKYNLIRRRRPAHCNPPHLTQAQFRCGAG